MKPGTINIPHDARGQFWYQAVEHWAQHANKMIFVALFVVLGLVGYFWALAKDKSRKGSGGAPAGLNYVVGPMGAGKSMFGVREIVQALVAGKFVVSNVRLLQGWERVVIDKHFPRDARNPERLAWRTAWLAHHYRFERSLRQGMRFRLPCATCGGDVRVCCGDEVPRGESHSGPHQEGRGYFVWDETHNDLNNRDYQGYGSDKAEREAEKEKRRLVVRWATQLRKLGYCGFLLSQHHENTDAQLRRVCNFIIRLQNQRNAEDVWLAKLLPARFTLFLVWWYPAHGIEGKDVRVQPTRRDRYWLPWWRTIYDSWETYHGIDDDGAEDDSPIQLAPFAPTLSSSSSTPDDQAPGGPSPREGSGATPPALLHQPTATAQSAALTQTATPHEWPSAQLPDGRHLRRGYTPG